MAALVASIGIVAAGSAAAGGGNSGAAAACQKGGWTSLYRADGSGFGNTGACVSYAARGGVLVSSSGPGGAY
ncbi:MAG TPA: hypothetical protein VJ986_08175 [Gaiellaceae bacterium]|nr:hypothetical protein [Gaiellaceae bacterium]